MRKIVSIRESILIDSSKESVWEFTQNTANRKFWDQTVLDCKVLETKPMKLIWLKMKGGVQTFLRYKWCDKPHKTSLKMCETKSLLFSGGGGSWTYTTMAGKTKWTQTNAVEFKSSILFFLLGWLIKKVLSRNTKVAMNRAKYLIENGLLGQ